MRGGGIYFSVYPCGTTSHQSTYVSACACLTSSLFKGVTHSGPEGFRNPRRHAKERRCGRPVLLAKQVSRCLHTGFKPCSAWHCLVRGAYCNQVGTLLFCFGSLLRPYKRVQQPDKEFSRTRGKWFVGWLVGTGWQTMLFFSPPLPIRSPSSLAPLSPWEVKMVAVRGGYPQVSAR